MTEPWQGFFELLFGGSFGETKRFSESNFEAILEEIPKETHEGTRGGITGRISGSDEKFLEESSQGLLLYFLKELFEVCWKS